MHAAHGRLANATAMRAQVRKLLCINDLAHRYRDVWHRDQR